MSSFLIFVLIPLILSIGLIPALQEDFIQEAEALKSKGNFLTETGSKKVCGDRLCSESSDREKQKYQESEPVFEQIIEAPNDEDRIEYLEVRVAELETQLTKYKAAEDTVQKNLDLFDELDLIAFNNRDMERIAEIHTPDVKVINRDGQVTGPFDPNHKDELLFLFETFPDFSINEHPIRFGQDDWTAGLSISTGTFLNSMELPDGTKIEPTGKSFEVRIVTLAKWEDGRIVKEYLIWDNEDWMRQIGVGELGKSKITEQLETQHLETFDELDFDVFTNQKWDRLKESHSENIIVHWPDGRTTEGIETHIDDLKAMFVYAPDTRVQQHPIKIASGQWTSVIGEIEGTFTEPMPLPDGSTIPPTGKSFKLTMNTVGYWENGVMVEEYLFWDNLEFMKQIGLN